MVQKDLFSKLKIERINKEFKEKIKKIQANMRFNTDDLESLSDKKNELEGIDMPAEVEKKIVLQASKKEQKVYQKTLNPFEIHTSEAAANISYTYLLMDDLGFASIARNKLL